MRRRTFLRIAAPSWLIAAYSHLQRALHGACLPVGANVKKLLLATNYHLDVEFSLAQKELMRKYKDGGSKKLNSRLFFSMCCAVEVERCMQSKLSCDFRHAFELHALGAPVVAVGQRPQFVISRANLLADIYSSFFHIDWGTNFIQRYGGKWLNRFRIFA
jgi:hypothetical protein